MSGVLPNVGCHLYPCLQCATLLRALAALSCLAVSAPARAAEPVLVDEVVAVVDARAILLSELEVEARLLRAREEGLESLYGPVSQDELRAALDRLIDFAVLYAEAERLRVFELAPAELDRGLAQLRARLGDEAPRFQRWYEVADETLAEIVRRELRVARYLEGRFRLAARPRDTELAAFYAAHAADFGGRTLEEAAAEVRVHLVKERFRQLADTFVADVRRRASVRILRDFEAPGAATPLSGSASAPEAQPAKGG